MPLGGWGLIGALVLLFWFASGFYMLDAAYRGVVLRFGAYREITLPGARWHLPYPIESVEKVNLSDLRQVEVGYRTSGSLKSKVPRESLMLTDDENIVDLEFAVQYTVSDPKLYLFGNRDTDGTVRQVAESSIRDVVGKNSLDQVLYESRDQIALQTKKLMQDILDHYRTGVLISNVTMQNAQPPEQVQNAFDDAVNAEQDRKRQINEGEAYSNKAIPEANGTASRLLAEANGYAGAVVANAEGDASRFRQILVEYMKAPAVTRERLYLDMMQSLLGSTSKILIDQKGGANNLIYLPVDKLIHDSRTAEGADAASVANPADASKVPSSDAGIGLEPPRSRDDLRNRENRQ
jgi:membrane protease subunit HflK